LVIVILDISVFFKIQSFKPIFMQILGTINLYNNAVVNSFVYIIFEGDELIYVKAIKWLYKVIASYSKNML